MLVSECYQCHSKDEKVKGAATGLEGRLAGRWRQRRGDHPGASGQEPLIQAIRYSDAELEMPPKKRLTAEQVADFEKWIAMGAPDPRRVPKSRRRISNSISRPPAVLGLSAGDQTGCAATKDKTWPHNGIDRHVLAALEAEGIGPGPDAEDLTCCAVCILTSPVCLPRLSRWRPLKAADTDRQSAIEKPSIRYWPARISASVGDGIGWMWCAFPRAPAADGHC